ncbi:MAG: hypothetical protein H0W83_15255, partial [Planctomycetes bacterium]|nr:hypothetical protein [Planctomycetota bacterium]
IYATPAPGSVSRVFLARVAIIDGEDRTPPTAPAAIAATLADHAVVVAWHASEDAVGTALYRVHRGMTADFVAGRENLVGETTAISFTDAALGNFGTYFYRVVPIDFSGNVGAVSEAGKVVVTE